MVQPCAQILATTAHRVSRQDLLRHVDVNSLGPCAVAKGNPPVFKAELAEFACAADSVGDRQVWRRGELCGEGL